MDKFTAFTIINNVVSKHDDEQLKAAWIALITPQYPSPPTPLGLAQIEATKLAHQFHKTGLLAEWRTPPQHSKAMERLIYRITSLLEAFLGIFNAELVEIQVKQWDGEQS